MTVATHYIFKKGKGFYLDRHSMNEKTRIDYCPYCGKKFKQIRIMKLDKYKRVVFEGFENKTLVRVSEQW